MRTLLALLVATQLSGCVSLAKHTPTDAIRRAGAARAEVARPPEAAPARGAAFDEENELRSRPRIDQAQRALVDGRHREAVAHAREALRIDPDATFAYRVLGVVGCRIGDPALVGEASLQLPASARRLLHSICGSYGH